MEKQFLEMETMRDLLLSWLLLVFLEVWSESQNHREALLDVQILEPSLDLFNLDLRDRVQKSTNVTNSRNVFFYVV